MPINELFPINRGSESSRGEEEVFEPAERYLRLFVEDRDAAETFLAGLIRSDHKRTLIRLNALNIEAAALEQYSSGKVKREKNEKLLQEYVDHFHSVLEKESLWISESTVRPNLVSRAAKFFRLGRD